MRARDRLAPVALTMGEPAGIGGEITLKAWLRRADQDLPPFFLFGNVERLTELSDELGLGAGIRCISEPGAAVGTFESALPVLQLAAPVTVSPGQPDPANAPATLESIERAVAATRAGEASAIVTNPVHKRTLYRSGFRHPGHTEFLGELAGGGVTPVMMIACPQLRVVPVTVHMPLAEALRRLDSERILTCMRATHRALIEDFGIDRPRLAVAGVNPHAGEGGELGNEEIDIIAPAIARACGEGMRARGPEPADSLFHSAARQTYDAAICMYHDQALVPLKTLDIRHGVNITLGLPFVRTSPDHGTALDIAGTGAADPASLIAAIKTASQIARTRAQRSAPTHAK